VRKVGICLVKGVNVELESVPFHGGNRGSNPRGDAKLKPAKLAKNPQIPGKFPLTGGGYYLPPEPADSPQIPGATVNKLRIGKRALKGAA
jgi:hypothetical protein